MPDKGWKAYERRCAKALGTTRIPVTGERHGADFRDALFHYQAKLRKRGLPDEVRGWLAGIVAEARATGAIGVLLVKRPRQADREAVVLIRWQDWVDLHGNARSQAARTPGVFEDGPQD